MGIPEGPVSGRKHYIYGESRKLITKDLVKLEYLDHSQGLDIDPPHCKFLWGPKVYAETTKMNVLDLGAKLNAMVASHSHHNMKKL